MKKILSMLLILAMLLTSTVSVSTEGVNIIESPDIPQDTTSGSLDDLKVDTPVDLGDRIYTPVKIEIRDKYFRNGESAFSDRYGNSGSENEFICLWLEALNLSNDKMMYFKDASVVVIYENDRGTYKFGGFTRQCRDDYEAYYAQDGFQSVGVLLKSTFLFGCTIPNYVVENPGSITMEITTDDTVMTCIIRE